MKYSDLQVGDWVNGKKWREKPFQIIRINDNGRFIYGKTADSIVGPFLIEELEPIPLTAEILERNGFVLKKRWAQKGNFGDNPLIMWHYDDDINTRDFKHELEIHQNDTGKVHVSIQCDYVHELQHALRLCRLNELPDNFKLDKD